MVDPAAALPEPPDPRVARARRIVLRIAWGVGFIFFVAGTFGAYHCATERPARELFFAPDDPIGDR
jgi:hypothetical protein